MLASDLYKALSLFFFSTNVFVFFLFLNGARCHLYPGVRHDAVGAYQGLFEFFCIQHKDLDLVFW